MNRQMIQLLLGAATAGALLMPAGASAAVHRKAPRRVHLASTMSRPPAQGQSVRASGDVVISIGRGQLIGLPGTMKDVFVADDKIADVQVKSNNQLYVYGRSAGETTIYASNVSGQVIWSANVRVGSNIDSVDQMLRVAMPEANISVATMGTNTVLLTGTVKAPEDTAEAQRLVQAFLGKEANVISRLKTATPLQVNLQVRIAEVSRSLTRAIGANLTTYSAGTSGVLFGLQRGANQGSITAGSTAGNNGGSITKGGATFTFPSNLTSSTALSLAGKAFGLDILGSLDLGEQAGLVTTLAQPNLTALSGETAEFLAGGEYPIPISTGLGTTSIEYKNYGVSLAYTPTVLADGRISLRVRPEVSELSTDGAVTLNGYTVPALTVRRAETTVELGSGQSFMIAGLLSNKASHTIEKLPGAGDIPVLGALFKSTSFTRGETELVIVVTPYLVKPVNDSDIKLPTDGLQNPDDVQRVLGNMLTNGKSGAQRPGPTAAPAASPPDGGSGASNGAPNGTKIGLGEQPLAPAPSWSKPGHDASKTADAADAKRPGFDLN